MKALLVIAAALAVCGCDPAVIVRNDWGNGTARVTLPEDTTGDMLSCVKTETPSNVVVTVTFAKKEWQQ